MTDTEATTMKMANGGYVSYAQIELGEGHSTIYAPVPEPRNDSYQQHELRPEDSAVIAQWRQRMASDEAKEIDKQRAATAECVNALARERVWFDIGYLAGEHEKRIAVACAGT